ncbi:MAG: hypothetical protein IPK79_11530 [Vampirovibrionales bacterium]|nr:hypothetical protein [Vampirovibrionales bacterium]
MAQLIQEPGWRFLVQIMTPELRARIQDTDSREAFLYEAIRLQAIQEVLSLPEQIIRQARRSRQTCGESQDVYSFPLPNLTEESEEIP